MRTDIRTLIQRRAQTVMSPAVNSQPHFEPASNGLDSSVALASTLLYLYTLTSIPYPPVYSFPTHTQTCSPISPPPHLTKSFFPAPHGPFAPSNSLAGHQLYVRSASLERQVMSANIAHQLGFPQFLIQPSSLVQFYPRAPPDHTS